MTAHAAMLVFLVFLLVLAGIAPLLDRRKD